MKDTCGQEIVLKRGDVVAVELKTGEKKVVWVLDVSGDAIGRYIDLFSDESMFSECTREICFDDVLEIRCLDNVHTRILSDHIRVTDIIGWYNRLRKYESYLS
ncbi:MAG: hypothetical protein HYT98_02910 [Candidatus Sungbacteria bacterium]|nr:hypothetical protein [Candidatus Sungbacteria bacterium]